MSEPTAADKAAAEAINKWVFGIAETQRMKIMHNPSDPSWTEHLADVQAAVMIRKVEIATLIAQNMAPERQAAAELLEAIEALVVMCDRGSKPQKFDEALTWRENDELAQSLARTAIAKFKTVN